MNLLSIVRQYVLGLLPYPDLARRLRIRRAADRLITCTKWPGDDATGPEAAQLALLRLLWLQLRIRRAVRGGRREEAALLARAALDTCLIGLYCANDTQAASHLAGANYRTLNKLFTSLPRRTSYQRNPLRQQSPVLARSAGTSRSARSPGV